ncbi:DUF2789 domain-containing protein [Aquabacterium sp.]|uniref:DUF2789 domain-containing protein n=1 Tax=Aquabacterium sp. TaxID=1872578 RepID=UPI002E34FDD4|nr:DUF2789 domain-containing protein [Aquabacterium sp.]HEX5312066.1 DUF2789 domain-containing protein [Aquabacterium sp.]
MNNGFHSLSELFRQLGLPDSIYEIDRFVAIHAPLPQGQVLADAPFWAPTQASFLREELADDADWAEVIDMLDARLRWLVIRTLH